MLLLLLRSRLATLFLMPPVWLLLPMMVIMRAIVIVRLLVAAARVAVRPAVAMMMAAILERQVAAFLQALVMVGKRVLAVSLAAVPATLAAI